MTQRTQAAGVQPPNPAPGTFETLCRQARALGEDAAFLALLRRPSPDQGDLLRLALDALPALELLPLPVLAEELGTLLNRVRRGERPAPPTPGAVGSA